MARVLIVEDEVLIAEDIRFTIEAIGHTVQGVIASGEEAAAATERERPDVILMDIYLRDKMDGIEAAETIYSRSRVPIIFLTAYADDTLLERAKRVGSFGYLLKPFHDYVLKAMIEMVLFKARSDEELRSRDQQQLLDQKFESLQTLTGGIAHHFNNILQSVMGNMDMALDILPAHGPGVDFLAKARHGLAGAADLGKTLLMCIGQPGGGEKGDHVELGAALTALVKEARLTLPDAITLEYRLADTPLQVRIDNVLFRQVIDQLVQNGIESIAKGAGLISVRVERVSMPGFIDGQEYQVKALPAGEYALVQVIDNGGGMSDEVRQKAFDPFFSTKFVGRGVGLSVALGIVRAHDGTIMIDGRSPQGTVVKVFLPLVASVV